MSVLHIQIIHQYTLHTKWNKRQYPLSELFLILGQNVYKRLAHVFVMKVIIINSVVNILLTQTLTHA